MRTFLAPSPADLFMRDVERRAEHPDAASTIGAVLHLTGAVPDLADLRQHVAARLAGLPCMSHILSGDGPAARWAPATPDTEHHIRAQHLAAGPEALDAAVRELAREPWPEGVPAWRLVLLHGHAPDGFALLYLTHHSVQDGGNIIAVLEALFGTPVPAGRSATVARGVPHSPRPRLRQVVRSTRMLLRHFGKHHLWSSPDQPLSSRRHTLWTQAPAAWLRTAARNADASTNDVYLTALAHAIEGWANTAWPRAAGAHIPVMVPINLRTADEVAVPGNRLFLIRLDLLGGARSLGQRLAHTRAVTTVLKSAEHKAVLRAALTRLPTRAFQRLVALSTAPGRLTLAASYLVMRHRLHYGDAEVDRMDPLMCCPPGAPMAVALLVYGATASVCFRIDEALLGGESLPARWRQALDEMSTTAEAAAD
ncbi:wax ester/triacylglycerol synthase domain-containing protein [Streptomyces sp. NPDC058249]|uniref:wax ester/triacylglycerol synthase domain-containing protein n=1 Tax=Streptomyces sp. NPDC058249 TaxID=3346403 RepID=UPI0036E6D824